MCDRKIGPYECCSVVEGDCLELIKQIPDGAVDAVITDPPYGMKWGGRITRGPNGTGKRTPSRHYGVTIVGDDKAFDPLPFLHFPKVILWGFQHYPERLKPGTLLVWLKRYDDGFGSFLSDGEAAWMNTGCGLYVMRDVSLQGDSNNRLHPTEKPVKIMQWCIEKAGFPMTILDPFCGSGTTLVAAKKLARHFLGFEIMPEYCAIARHRLAAVDTQLTLDWLENWTEQELFSQT